MPETADTTHRKRWSRWGAPARPVGLVMLVCCLSGLAASTGAGAHSTARRSSRSQLVGVNIGGLAYRSTPAEADQEIAAARALHATVVRAEIPWSVMEPQSAASVDPRALAFTDRLLADASAAGIGVIMTLRSTPCWASSAPAALMARCSTSRTSSANAWPPRDPAAFGAFAAYIAGRYGGHGLAAVEVWNEPDQANQLYFAGPQKPRRYVALLRAAYPEVKKADAAVPVLAGSLVGSNGVFLRQLYAAGIKGYYDGLAVHFYNLTLGSVRSIHEAQLAAGDTKPLWLDEFGWTSCWPKRRIEEEQACVTSAAQAHNMRDTIRALASAPYVVAEVVFKLRDSRGEDFGLLTRAGARKSSFRAIQEAISAPLGSISPVTVRLGVRRGRIVASGSAPVGDFMGLEAFEGSRPRFRAVFVLDRFNHFSIALPRVLRRPLRVVVFQYWKGLAGAAQGSI